MQVIKLNNCIWTFFKRVIQASAFLTEPDKVFYQMLPSPKRWGVQPCALFLVKWT